MATLTEIATGRAHPLQPEHVVGRAPTCALRLLPRYVSAQHALLRWTGRGWEIRDLSSTNGTFVDGSRIEPGMSIGVNKGSSIAFGRSDETWRFVDDGPPSVMVVPLDGGDPVIMGPDLLALPSADDPSITIYRDVAAGWVLEQPDESTQIIENGHVFEAAGRWWRFCCADEVSSSAAHATAPLNFLVQHTELFFEVTRNEEHVVLSMRCNGRPVPLGSRVCYFLLLFLARQRLADREAGHPEGECGWTCPEDFPNDARMVAAQVTLDVFRIRQSFAQVGISDFANLIERRPLTRELRIGTGHLKIRVV